MSLRSNRCYSDLSVVTGNGSDDVELRDNKLYGHAAVDTGAAVDEVSVGYKVTNTMHPANTFLSDLSVSTGDGGDAVDVYYNTVDGSATIHSGAGNEETLDVTGNVVHDCLSVTNGDGVFDQIRVSLNTVDRDAIVTTGDGWKYVAIVNENVIGGNLSVDGGNCTFYVLDVETNLVRSTATRRSTSATATIASA